MKNANAQGKKKIFRTSGVLAIAGFILSLPLLFRTGFTVNSAIVMRLILAGPALFLIGIVLAIAAACSGPDDRATKIVGCAFTISGWFMLCLSALAAAIPFPDGMGYVLAMAIIAQIAIVTLLIGYGIKLFVAKRP